MSRGVALVTGATGGIGKEIALQLIQKDWIVGVQGRDSSAVQKLCRKLGPNARPLVFDVCDKYAVTEQIRLFIRSEGGLDALVHSAGIMDDVSILMVDEILVDRVFKTNVYGTFWVLQSCLKPMIRNKSGVAVLISSIAGIDGAQGQSVYSASKSAVNAIVKSVSKEVSRFGVRVNAIAPGPVDTELFSAFDDEIKNKIKSSIPLGRIATPQDIATIALLLVSHESSYITGQVIRVDGGLSV